MTANLLPANRKQSLEISRMGMTDDMELPARVDLERVVVNM